MPEQTGISGLIEELRRRRVFRVAAFYGGIAFVIVQIIDGTFDLMGVPQWIGRVIVTLLALGFPVSMILAWIFDITPDGIVRTKGNTIPSTSRNKPGTSNGALIALTIAAIAFGVWDRIGPHRDEGPIILAVLPFQNYNDESNDWFADGFTDVMTGQLAKLTDIGVIARTSTMHYKYTTLTSSEVGRELGADVVLEGSILRADGQVLITAQLIDTKTDQHIWSNSYKREAANIIALQSDVATNIAMALKDELTAADIAVLEEPMTTSELAFDHYLKGKSIVNRAELQELSFDDEIKAFREWVESFELAVAIDPRFAEAHYELVLSYSLAYFNWEETPEMLERATNALIRAESQAGNRFPIKLARGVYHYYAERNYKLAIGILEPLLKEHSRNVELLRIVAYVNRRLGRWDETISLLTRAGELDVRNADTILNLLATHIRLGNANEANRLLKRLDYLGSTGTYAYRSSRAINLRGDLDEAWSILEDGFNQLGSGPLDNRIILTAMYRRDLESLKEYSPLLTESPEYLQKWVLAVIANLEDDIESQQKFALAAYDSFLEENLSQRGNFHHNLAYIAAAGGDKITVRSLGEKALKASHPKLDATAGPDIMAYIGVAYIMIGDIEQGFDLVDEAFSYPLLTSVNDLRFDPFLDHVREHPRYLTFMDKYSGGK